MKQVLQNLKTSTIEVADVPTPLCRPGPLLIATRRSLISAGTERMLVEFGQANLLPKARARPELRRQLTAIDSVKNISIRNARGDHHPGGSWQRLHECG